MNCACVCVWRQEEGGVCVLVIDVSLFLFVVSQECSFSHAVNQAHTVTGTHAPPRFPRAH